MNIAIIEDEKPAAEKLTKLIKTYDSSYCIFGPFSSISSSVEFLSNNMESIDLLFVDIQLTDGISFSIFEQINIQKPIIFTTAFNEYAIQAFKLNSIDYILKPYNLADIESAFVKYKSLKSSFSDTNQSFDIKALQEMVSQKPNYKTRFMVRKGDKIKAIETKQIKLFYADDRDVYLLNDENRRYSVNLNLEEVNKLLDPETFFRVNRTFIVQFNAISEIIAYSNSRLKLDVGFKTDKDIIVSRDKVAEFKKWIEG